MAVQVLPLPGTLVLRLVTGVDESGEPVHTNRRWSNVNPDADNEAVFDVARALAGLQIHALTAVERQENSRLAEE